MSIGRYTYLFIAIIFVLIVPTSTSAEDNEDQLSEIEVLAKRVSIEPSSSSTAVLVSNLKYSTGVDIQTRGSSEGQSDIAVYGGIFENTGIKVGAVILHDPQTGHYAGDVPLPSEYLSLPKLRKGIDNALAGFNSSVATVDYSLSPIHKGGQAKMGFGNDSMSRYSLSTSGDLRGRATNSSLGGGSLVGNLSYARSTGDGSVPNGDHSVERISARLQYLDDTSQTDAIFAYQDRFYGWPGAYTGFGSFAETDQTKTSLILVNRRQSTGEHDWWEAGAYYRNVRDDYDFDRFNKISGGPGAFDHETNVYGIALQGTRRIGELHWRYNAQVTTDELARSTDLNDGNFDSRSYGSLSVVPEKHFSLSGGSDLGVQFGFRYDASNRDSDSLSPLVGVVYQRPNSRGTASYRLEYSGSSQLPGYTALNSRPAGLFGGNADLGRERARSIEIEIEQETGNWLVRATVFVRKDDKLVDWTYLSGAPFARQANAVDIDVSGVELFAIRYWQYVDLAVGYTHLQKDANYGSALVDASYYALNFPDNRLVISASYRPTPGVELTLHNELRDQHRNPLRSGPRRAFISMMNISWRPLFAERFLVTLTANNLTNSDFEEFPGTPTSRRQILLDGRYEW